MLFSQRPIRYFPSCVVLRTNSSLISQDSFPSLSQEITPVFMFLFRAMCNWLNHRIIYISIDLNSNP